MMHALFGATDAGFNVGHVPPSFRFDTARPAPRATPKAARPVTVCSRCAGFSFFGADAGKRCDRMHRGSGCAGVMRAASQRDDWRACDWCSRSGWHRGMCCARCQGSGWLAKRPGERQNALLNS